MGKVAISEEYLSDIADSIREKLDSQDTFKVSEMSDAIDSIETGGGDKDLSDYFNINPTELETSQYSRYWLDLYFIKKCPDVIIPNNITNVGSICRDCKWTVVPKFIFGNNVFGASYMFYGCSFASKIDTSGFDISKLNDCSYMFGNTNNENLIIDTSGLKTCVAYRMRYMFGSYKNTSLDLKDFYSSSTNIDARQMFDNCTNLQFLDMRSFDFTHITQTSNMFLQVPTNCLIIVKDETQKTWFTTNFSSMTNVKTVEQYEAM